MKTIETDQYGTINLSWIRFLYGATAFVGITVGSVMLLAPDFSRKVVGFPDRLPEQDPVIFGALAAVWTAVGILCLFGLRAPMRFLPIFAIQLFYKTLWCTFVLFPMLLGGDFPTYAWASLIGNLTWIVMDIKATPWRYLFAAETPSAALEGSVTETSTFEAPNPSGA